MAKTRTQPNPDTSATDTVKVFDLASRFMAPTIEVKIMDTLVDRTQDTGVRITLKSPQSVEARDAARTFRAALALEGGDMTAQQIDDLFLEQLVACTCGWAGFTFEGADLPCTAENVRTLYGNPACGWIYQQVMTAFLDTARFFDAKKTS